MSHEHEHRCVSCGEYFTNNLLEMMRLTARVKVLEEMLTKLFLSDSGTDFDEELARLRGTTTAKRPVIFQAGDIVRALDRKEYKLIEKDTYDRWTVERDGKVYPPECKLPEAHMELVIRAPIDSNNPNQRVDPQLVAALVMKAGGEVKLTERDLKEALGLEMYRIDPIMGGITIRATKRDYGHR